MLEIADRDFGVVVVEFLQAFGGQILEAGEFFFPPQLDFAHRAVPLFGDDDLGQALVLLLLFAAQVVLFAVDEHHHVGVLLDRARLAEVAQSRAMVAGVFRLAVQLGQAQDRDFGFPRQPLQSPRDPRHLFLAGIVRVVRLDQLQVVDGDQPQTALTAFDPPRGGGDLADRAGRRVVHEQAALG